MALELMDHQDAIFGSLFYEKNFVIHCNRSFEFNPSAYSIIALSNLIRLPDSGII